VLQESAFTKTARLRAFWSRLAGLLTARAAVAAAKALNMSHKDNGKHNLHIKEFNANAEIEYQRQSPFEQKLLRQHQRVTTEAAGLQNSSEFWGSCRSNWVKFQRSTFLTYYCSKLVLTDPQVMNTLVNLTLPVAWKPNARFCTCDWKVRGLYGVDGLTFTVWSINPDPPWSDLIGPMFLIPMTLTFTFEDFGWLRRICRWRKTVILMKKLPYKCG